MAVKDGVRSPASLKMDEAIERAIEEKPIVPERSSFIDADSPYTEDAMRQAAKEGYSAVVVSSDGSTCVYPPEEILGRDVADPA